MSQKSLIELKNIGQTVASKLLEIGVTNEDTLGKLGAAQVYKKLSKINPKLMG